MYRNTYQTSLNNGLFSIPNPYRTPIKRKSYDLIKPIIESVLGMEKAKGRYRLMTDLDGDDLFYKSVLDVLNIYVDIQSSDLQKIPVDKPVIVVANHPFGAVEGMIMATLLNRIRKDFKILANNILYRLPGADQVCIPINPFGGQKAVKDNYKGLRTAISLLKNNGMLGVFPAGEVAHFKTGKLRITEPVWQNTVAKLVKMTGASVIPMFFKGRNSLLFQSMGLVNSRFRTIMLLREMFKKEGASIKATVGNSIPAKKLLKFQTPEESMSYLRSRTLMLQYRDRQSDPSTSKTQAGLSGDSVVSGNNRQIDDELTALPFDKLLLTHEEYHVYCASAAEIPNTLYEIGRLREVTFRESGEGTGNHIDLDDFDEYYQHLFIWNRKKKEIVGAYRLGETDKILRRYGKKGLYTHTLFKYRTKFVERLNPALELGRSFIVKDYQKSFLPLLLLWKGIGHFILQHPQY